MNVYWTDTAKSHLIEIQKYISKHSENYARRTINSLTKKTIQLSTFPLSGRVVPEFNIEQIRELIEGPYRIIYYIKPNQVDVLAVIHGAQNVLSEM